MWSEYGGLSAQAYGCGPCAADSTATCVDCDAAAEDADAGCNIKVAAPGKHIIAMTDILHQIVIRHFQV